MPKGIDLNPFDNIGASAAQGFLDKVNEFLSKYPLLQDGLRGEKLTIEASFTFRIHKAE